MTKLNIIFCAPLSKYPEPPKDNNNCILESCDHCNELMWISERKLFIRDKILEDNGELWCGCFNCLEQFIANNKDYFKSTKSSQFNISSLEVPKH